MQLYFVRHGESTANLLHEFANSGFKHPLTDRGVSQAHTLAHKLSGLSFDIIYASPVMRAVQTAVILAEHLHTRLIITEALREWSVGIYEGTSDPAGWELHRQVQEDWFIHHKPESKMPGGESWLDMKARFVPFIEGLVQDGQYSERKLLLVGHGGLYLAMLPAILKNVDFSLASQGFPYTACTVAETRPCGLHCLFWCDKPLND